MKYECTITLTLPDLPDAVARGFVATVQERLRIAAAVVAQWISVCCGDQPCEITLSTWTAKHRPRRKKLRGAWPSLSRIR